MNIWGMAGALCFQLILPLVVGGLFVKKEYSNGTDFLRAGLLGQLLIWACFQLLAVPMILLEKTFAQLTVAFSVCLMVMGVYGILQYGRKGYLSRQFWVREKNFGKRDVSERDALGRTGKILWFIFGAVLVLQLILAVVLTYQDGDDAFYVAISTSAAEGGVMYRVIPYTGWPSDVNLRYGLAPFPLWAAYISRVFGVQAVVVAHVLQPLVYLPMTYGVFALLGGRLFAEKKKGLPVFMLFCQALIVFGDYSIMSPENFLVARSRQGKAMLATVILPMLVYLTLYLLEQKKAKDLQTWLELLCCSFSACLCSTMGGLVCMMLLGITGLCASVVYKKAKFLWGALLVCVPSLAYAVLYLWVG